MAKSKKKKYILPLIIVVIIALAVMKSCGVFGSNEKLDQVDTQQATTATIVQIVTASGKIKPSTEVKIAPEVSGEITQLTVKEGDEVKKGQLLVQIKQDIYISAVNRAQAAVQQAIASLEQSAARLKESHGTGPVHRHAGSMGSGTDPSRIFKGKIGAGQMGNEQVTVLNLDVVKVDTELGLIAVRGAIPGPKGGIVTVRNSVINVKEKGAAAGISSNPQKASARVNPQKASARNK